MIAILSHRKKIGHKSSGTLVIAWLGFCFDEALFTAKSVTWKIVVNEGKDTMLLDKQFGIATQQ